MLKTQIGEKKKLLCIGQPANKLFEKIPVGMRPVWLIKNAKVIVVLHK